MDCNKEWIDDCYDDGLVIAESPYQRKKVPGKQLLNFKARNKQIIEYA